MRRRILTAVIGAILVSSAAVGGQTTAPATKPALPPRDLDLLHQLETGTWRERKSAEAELAQRGVDELPILRAMLAHTASAEARARLSGIVDQLEERKLIGPSLITLHRKDVPAKAVYAEVFRQADATLVCDPANLLDTLKPISIDADRLPFWSVMLQLHSQSNVWLQRAADGTCTLTRAAQIAPGPRVIIDQLLVVLSGVRPIGRSPKLPLAERQFRVDLTFYAEPKSRFIPIVPHISDAQATDNLGNAVRVSLAPAVGGFVGVTPIDWQPMSLFLELPAKNPGGHLASLRLKMSVEMALHHEHVEIADVMHAPPQVFDVNGTPVKFTGCKKVGQIYTIAMTSAPDPSGHVQRVIENPRAAPQLLDTAGQSLQHIGSQTAYRPEGNAITFMFAQTPVAPKTFIWDIPTDIRSIDVPIDFKDIDIPLPGF